MMPIADTVDTARMSPQQRTWFYAEYEHARKDEIVGVLLALFLGCFGIHHFYLRRNGLGVLYVLFSWTGITAILGIVECFLMPGRVRDYNAVQAASIASHIMERAVPYSPSAARCSVCGVPTEPGASFCTHCGAATAAPVPFPSQPTA